MHSIQLILTDIEFTYPGMTVPLFSGLSVQFPIGWTGIAGANGSGKSTLLQIATGIYAPQQGKVFAQGLALYVAQRTDEPPALLEDFIWDPDALVLKSRLQIGDDWPERWSTLSHGERKRAQIAVALWQQPVILALDEPSNHIDSDARQLLETVLRDFHGIGLLVSHDRELLDTLCSNCLLLDPPHATMRPGNITEALAQQEIDEKTAQYESEALRHAANRLRAEAQRRRVIADQKASAARGSKQDIKDHDARAMRNLAKLTGKDAYAGKLAAQMAQKAAKVENQRESISIKKQYETGIWIDGASYSPRDFLLKLPAGTIPLGKSRVLSFPDLIIGGTNRIALTGANGLGKSTLIRHILANLQISAEKIVNIPQEITAEESRNLLETIKLLPNQKQGQIMTTISRLGSRPARLIESFQPSPGEVRKLLLALGIIHKPHLIIMDEPTNHMDLPSIICMEEALAECPCAMLLASHDRSFLQKITRTSWQLNPDKNGNTQLSILPLSEP